MSRWTHIRGGMELVSNPHEFKGESPDYHYGSKDAYLPYPEEQLKISAPTAHVFTKNKKGEKDVKLKFRAYLYSLPRAKKYIKEAFDLLPQGEVGWSYSMNQTIHNGSSSNSDFDCPCDVKAFKQAVTNMYHSEDAWVSYDYNELRKHYHANLSWVEIVDEIIIGIREDIRHCSGEEMLKGLEKFFTYLREHDIEVEDGYLEWEDEYTLYFDKPYYYCWRCSRISDEMEALYSFHKIEYKTNKILWTKTYRRPYLKDENGKETERIDFRSREVVTEEHNFEDPISVKNKEENNVASEAVSEKTND